MRARTSEPQAEWGTAPLRDSKIPKLDLVRAKAGKTISVIILSHSMHGCDTHYMGGRTVGHTTPDCAGCDAAIRRRWYCYLHIYNERTLGQAVLELTDACYEPLLRCIEARGTLRGTRITYERKNEARNSQVKVRFGEVHENVSSLPNEIDIEGFMERLWKSKSKEPDALDNTKIEDQKQNWNSSLHSDLAELRAKGINGATQPGVTDQHQQPRNQR